MKGATNNTNETKGGTMTTTEFEKMQAQRYDRKLADLAGELGTLLQNGDISTQEANTWMVFKQEQWAAGDR